MTWNDPNYQKRRGGGVPLGNHTLSDTEYTKLQLLLPYAGKQPLTDTTAVLLTDLKGNILYGVEV